MAKIVITVPGERVVDEFTALVAQPTTPTGARPPDIGLVEVSQSTPTQLIPGPPGAQGPRGSRWYTGNGAPNVTAGVLLGDQYLDNLDGHVWTFGTAWVDTGTDLTGPQGGPDTAAQVLAKLITVDGAGSGLDADLLDGQTGAYYSAWGNLTGKPATFPPTLPITEADVTNLVSDLALKAPLVSPALTGAPTTPTAAPGTATTQIASTAFVGAAVGVVVGTATPAMDTLGEVEGYINGTLIPSINAKAPIASPAFTGNPTGPTPAPGDNDTSLATTAFVAAAVAPLAPIASPTFTGDPKAPTPAAADNDTSVATTAFVKTALAAIGGPTAQTRNRIVNPAFQHSQENGVTGGSTNTYYFADQWLGTHATNGTVTYSMLANQPSTHPARNVGRAFGNVADTSIAAGEVWRIEQSIEGSIVADFCWGSAQAKQAVLRFDFIALTSPGTYSVLLRNGAGNMSYVATFVATVSWQTFTFVIPGPTSGAFAVDQNVGLYVGIALMCGSTYAAPSLNQWNSGLFFGASGQRNGLDTINADFRFANFGLYLDPANTGLAPPFVEPDYSEELLRCMRYWQTFYGVNSYTPTSGQSYYMFTSCLAPCRPGALVSGTNMTASNFGTTVGTLAALPNGARELRAATVTASAGAFGTQYILNGRL